MRRLVFAVLSWCVVAFAVLNAGPSYADDYYYGYGDGYAVQPYRGGDSGSCCYRRVERAGGGESYVRVERYGYDGPYGYRYGEEVYRYRREYRPYRAEYPVVCTMQNTPVYDGRGGWVWGVRRVCH